MSNPTNTHPGRGPVDPRDGDKPELDHGQNPAALFVKGIVDDLREGVEDEEEQSRVDAAIIAMNKEIDGRHRDEATGTSDRKYESQMLHAIGGSTGSGLVKRLDFSAKEDAVFYIVLRRLAPIVGYAQRAQYVQQARGLPEPFRQWALEILTGAADKAVDKSKEWPTDAEAIIQKMKRKIEIFSRLSHADPTNDAIKTKMDYARFVIKRYLEMLLPDKTYEHCYLYQVIMGNEPSSESAKEVMRFDLPGPNNMETILTDALANRMANDV